MVLEFSRFEERPEERDGDPVMGDGQHETIEIDRAKLPSPAIQAERPGRIEWQETHDKWGNEGRRDLECLKKSLNSTIR